MRTTIISGGSAAESSELLRTAIGLGTDAVVVAGGDGTVHLAIQELAGTGIPLGIIPAGHRQRLRQRRSGCASSMSTRPPTRSRPAGPGASTSPASPASTAPRRSSARCWRAASTRSVNDRANAMRWPRGGSRYNIAILIEFLHAAGHPVRGRARARRRHARAHRRRPRDGDRRQRPHLRRRHPDLPRRRPGGRAARCRRSCDPPAACACCGCSPASTAGRTRACRRSRRAACARCGCRRPGVTAYADGDPIGALPLTIDVAPAALSVFAP